MTDPTLDQLIASARQHSISVDERRDQGISFTLGNLVVETPNLFRGTVTMAVPREAFDRATLVASVVVGHIEPRIPFDPIGAVRQFRLVQQLAERHAAGEPLAITPLLIRELHAAAGDPADPAFGNFRTLAIEVRGSSHVAPSASEVDALVEEFCDELNARWETDDALTLGAFALWRIAWIHPFVDGNGRVSRALSYLILCLKFGLLLPGAPTLVEQLADRREQYFNALAAADLSYLATGIAELAPLVALLRALLVRQLRNVPALSGQDEAAIATIFRRRILAADPAVRARLYGAEIVQYRNWASGGVLIVHIGSDKAIAQAEALFVRHGRPFPGLIAEPEQDALLTIGPERNGTIIRLRDFRIGSAAMHLEPDTAVTLEAPDIVFDEPAETDLGWKIGGALYVMRFGARISEVWVADSFDLLVSRHLQAH